MKKYKKMTQFLVSKKLRHVIFFYLLRNHGAPENHELFPVIWFDILLVYINNKQNTKNTHKPSKGTIDSTYARQFISFLRFYIVFYSFFQFKLTVRAFGPIV